MKGLGILLCACAALAADSPDPWKAIHDNDLSGLRASLKAGKDANLRDSRQATLLMHAASFGSPEAVRILLDAGADPKAKNAFDATALLWAAGDAAKSRLLIEAGADVNVRSKQGRTPLIVAASADANAETVRLLLAKDADPNAKGARGETALQAACASGDLESVRLLVAKGADVNQADLANFTPIHQAVTSNNLELVRFLIAKGARVNVANSFAGAVKFGPIAMIKMTPLIYATPHGSPSMVKALLDAGADVNAVDSRGMTPLMFAVASETQDPEVVRLLLAKGAEVNRKSAAGETALDWALRFNHPAVLRQLRVAGAEPALHYDPPKLTAAKRDARAAVEKSAALLQRSSTEFFKQSGCVGCHHQNMTALAVTAARAAGVRVDEAAAIEQMKVTMFGWSTFSEGLLQRIDPPGGADMLAYSLLGLHYAGHRADATTDAMIANLAPMQRADGSWTTVGVSRAPIEEGNIARTALALRSLQLYAIPGRKAEFDQRITRARAWLLEAQPRNTDDLAMRLAGLQWSGADATEVAAAARALSAAQRDDGGWAQNPNLAADPYATGQALHTLRDAGFLKGSDPAYQKGVRFLLDRQCADGSWYVRSRAPKFQPYFQSGFPFDHDQWISASATALATAAVAGSLAPQQASLQVQ